MMPNKRSISTRIELVFRKRPDGLWQQYRNFLIDLGDKDGNKITKIDRVEIGLVFKEAAEGEHSRGGEHLWLDVETGATLRLIALSNFQQGNSK